MKRNRNRVRLGKRDRKILHFIGEQRMSWLEAIHQRFYEGRAVDAAKSTMRRLSGAGPKYRYVCPESLDGRRVYYRLTPAAARMLGFPSVVTHPLGRTALIRRYAMQWFIALDGQGRRWPCNPRDYPELFAVGRDRLPRANFYLGVDESGEQTMGFAIEDYGSDVRRIVRRAIDHLERFMKREWFDDLLAAERFTVTFLTVTEEKARALRKQFDRDSRHRVAAMLRRIAGPGHSVMPAEYLVVPGLLDLVPTPEDRR